MPRFIGSHDVDDSDPETHFASKRETYPMINPQNVFAYTANTPSYPEYVSVNRTHDGRLTISVRSPLIKDGLANDKGETFDTAGVTAEMTLPHDQLSHLIDGLKAYYRVYGEPAAALDN